MKVRKLLKKRSRGLITYATTVNEATGEFTLAVPLGRRAAVLHLSGDALVQFVELVNEALATCRPGQ